MQGWNPQKPIKLDGNDTKALSHHDGTHKFFRSQKSNLGKLQCYLADILTQGNNLVLMIPDLNFKTSTTNKTNDAVHIITPLDISHQRQGRRV